ncbi:MAG: hypothetical protein RI939_1531 [Actinomycetota bacterium]
MSYRRLLTFTFLVTALLTLTPDFAVAATESKTGAVLVSVYNRSSHFQSASGPPMPTARASELPFHQTSLLDINQDWGFGSILGTTLSNRVLVNFKSVIRPPILGRYQVCAFSDDGFVLDLDGIRVIDDWFDRDSGWIDCSRNIQTKTISVDFSTGLPKTLSAWYYENWGAAVVQLRYLSRSGWVPIPSSWYLAQSVPVAPTSTTTPAATTTSSTTPTKTGQSVPVAPTSATTPIEAFNTYATTPAYTIRSSPTSQHSTVPIPTTRPVSSGQASVTTSPTSNTNSSGGTNFYDARGTRIGSSNTNSSGRTNFYDARGTKIGSSNTNSSGGTKSGSRRGG